MTDTTLHRFIESFYEDITDAMKSADEAPVDEQYRLGVRRLAKAFFDKIDLFDLESEFKNLRMIDVDSWFSGK